LGLQILGVVLIWTPTINQTPDQQANPDAGRKFAIILGFILLILGTLFHFISKYVIEFKIVKNLLG
jgi:vacuolar-type H+-ATPase subunit I/STV1